VEAVALDILLLVVLVEALVVVEALEDSVSLQIKLFQFLQTILLLLAAAVQV
jgi:hypothetical protein